MEQKNCKKCNAEYQITDEDLAFYKQVSPTFAGKTFEIPAPTLCPDCRAIRRYIWRNERALYKRKSDKSGEEIVTVYSPDKKDLTVYSIDEWWADDWDATNYGRDFDFSKPFFEQFEPLLKEVPLMALRNTKTENCNYVNYTAESRNCYMSVVAYYGTEDSHYSYWVYSSKNCVDCSFVDHDENCYELVTSNYNYGCRYSLRINNCRECFFCIDLTGCNNCILCDNLNHKEYCIRNKQLTKEEYEVELSKIDLGSHDEIEKLKKDFERLRKNKIVKFATQINCEDCEGDDLLECKDVKKSFSCIRHEHTRYSHGGSQGSSWIWDAMGGSYQWVLESQHSGFGSNLMFCSGTLFCSNMIYCENCQNSRDCFGCVGLKGKQYCVFNKEYSKGEYEQKVAQIIEHMQKSGEWGEFFPYRLCPFGYNETLSHLYFPKTKEQALKEGFKWQDNDFAPRHSDEFYEPKDDIQEYIDSEEERKKLLSGVVKCEKSGRPFKIVPQELAFYLQQGVPIPHEHYDVRFAERFAMRNPRHLYHRQCMKEGCTNEFETTYAPERAEKVYCEKCYQGIIN